MKMPEPTMPPMTIMVASNAPSNCRGLAGSKELAQRDSSRLKRGSKIRVSDRKLNRDHLTIAVNCRPYLAAGQPSQPAQALYWDSNGLESPASPLRLAPWVSLPVVT